MHETCLIIIHDPTLRPGPGIEPGTFRLVDECSTCSTEATDTSVYTETAETISSIIEILVSLTNPVVYDIYTIWQGHQAVLSPGHISRPSTTQLNSTQQLS